MHANRAGARPPLDVVGIEPAAVGALFKESVGHDLRLRRDFPEEMGGDLPAPFLQHLSDHAFGVSRTEVGLQTSP